MQTVDYIYDIANALVTYDNFSEPNGKFSYNNISFFSNFQTKST